MFLGKSLIIPSNGGFAKVPGSESKHLDMEKLCLLSISNENLNFAAKIQKNLPEKIRKLRFSYVFLFSLGPFINRRCLLPSGQASTSDPFVDAKIGDVGLSDFPPTFLRVGSCLLRGSF